MDNDHGLLCNRCSKLALAVRDEVNKIDARLRLIANLLGACTSSMIELDDVFPSVATAIDDHLEHRRAVDAAVFGGESDDEELLGAEVERLRRVFGCCVSRPMA